MNQNYSHHIPGRIRVRIPALKANAKAAQKLQIEMRQLPGVTSVEVNLLTGSVLVHYGVGSDTAERVCGHLQSREECLTSNSMATSPPRKAYSLLHLNSQLENQKAAGQIGEMVVKAAATYLLDEAIKRVFMATLIVLL